MSKHCRIKECNVELVVGENWKASQQKNSNYKCKKCHYQWLLDNPDSRKKASNKYNMKSGIGVYQVMLGSICMYVGEGQLRSRRKKHLKYCSAIDSKVYSYCLKHNISRSLLSFNVLEYEDDEQHRKDLEDWYITFLTPVINPKPPLGIYV